MCRGHTSGASVVVESATRRVSGGFLSCTCIIKGTLDRCLCLLTDFVFWKSFEGREDEFAVCPPAILAVAAGGFGGGAQRAQRRAELRAVLRHERGLLARVVRPHALELRGGIVELLFLVFLAEGVELLFDSAFWMEWGSGV